MAPSLSARYFFCLLLCLISSRASLSLSLSLWCLCVSRRVHRASFITPLPLSSYIPPKVTFGERSGNGSRDAEESGGQAQEQEHEQGGMAVHGGGLELTYRRSARRRGGLEAAVGAVSLVDLSKGAAFSRLVSPGKPQGTVVDYESSTYFGIYRHSYCLWFAVWLYLFSQQMVSRKNSAHRRNRRQHV